MLNNYDNEDGVSDVLQKLISMTKNNQVKWSYELDDNYLIYTTKFPLESSKYNITFVHSCTGDQHLHIYYNDETDSISVHSNNTSENIKNKMLKLLDVNNLISKIKYKNNN